MKGFIKVSREFLENKELNRSAEHLCLYVHILSRVSFCDGAFCVFGGKRIELNRGQMVTSIRNLAEETGISKSKIARILDLFKKWDVIRTECGTRQTLITVGLSDTSGTESGTNDEQIAGQCWDTGEEKKDEKEKRSKREKVESKELLNKNKKENKEIYGVFENVKLFRAEFEAFKAQFPINYSRYIDDLSRYIASRGDKYQSHYATLLSWNKDKSDEMSSFDTDEFFQAALKRSEEHIRQRASEHKGKNDKVKNAAELGW